MFVLQNKQHMYLYQYESLLQICLCCCPESFVINCKFVENELGNEFSWDPVHLVCKPTEEIHHWHSSLVSQPDQLRKCSRVVEAALTQGPVLILPHWKV